MAEKNRKISLLLLFQSEEHYHPEGRRSRPKGLLIISSYYAQVIKIFIPTVYVIFHPKLFFTLKLIESQT